MSRAVRPARSRTPATWVVVATAGVSLLAGCGSPVTQVVAVNDCSTIIKLLIVDTQDQRGHDPIDYTFMFPGDSEEFRIPVASDGEVAVMVFGPGDSQVVTTIVSLTESASSGDTIDGVPRRFVTVSGDMCPGSEQG